MHDYEQINFSPKKFFITFGSIIFIQTYQKSNSNGTNVSHH